MSCLLEKRNPTIFGNGSHSRDFIFVQDIVNLLLQASAAPAAVVSGNVYNAGNGVRTTLNEVWDLLQKMEGLTLPAKYAPERPGDVRDSQADINAAIRDLGYQPQFSLEEGLRMTLDWYRG
jgi:UDP-glucose 4-epimerase